MDLDDGALKLIDPESLTTLHTQPIHTIRVWGVGRDNGRWDRPIADYPKYVPILAEIKDVIRNFNDFKLLKVTLEST